jgi:hypothetical protein
MSTRADLVVDLGTRRLVRETKSVGSQHEMPLSAGEVFERYPQIAVTLCMLADGLDPVTGEVAEEPLPSRVEVEILRTDGHEVRGFDTADAEAVLIARATVAEAVDTILYSPAEPTVGRHCAWCPVSRWCDAYRGQSRDVPDAADPATDERPRMSLLAYAEAVTLDGDSEMPF